MTVTQAPQEADWEAYEELKLSFKCGRCGARPDAECTDPHGRPARFVHADRHNRAWTLIEFAADPPTPLQRARAQRLAKEWRR